MCRLLEICGWLENTHRGSSYLICTRIKQERAQKCNLFCNFYTKKSKCFDLDGYRAKKLKSEKNENHEQAQTTVNKKAPIHYVISINDKVYRPL